MQKRAQMYYRNPCTACEEARRFLEDNGVYVQARDLTRLPFKRFELENLMGYLDPKHYLDIFSPTYQKKKLDSFLPPRDELLKMVEDHPELLRHPIIFSGRLMTIGFNRQQLIEMFQLTVSDNGSKSNGENGFSDNPDAQ